jgi:hypothetical protein
MLAHVLEFDLLIPSAVGIVWNHFSSLCLIIIWSCDYDCKSFCAKLNYYVIEFCFYLFFWVWWDHCLDLKSKFWIIVTFSFGVKRSYVVYPPEGPRPPSPEEMREMARELARKRNNSSWCSFGLQVKVVAFQLYLPGPVRNEEMCNMQKWTSPNWFPKSNNLVGLTNIYIHLFSFLFLAWEMHIYLISKANGLSGMLLK